MDSEIQKIVLECKRGGIGESEMRHQVRMVLIGRYAQAGTDQEIDTALEEHGW